MGLHTDGARNFALTPVCIETSASNWQSRLPQLINGVTVLTLDLLATQPLVSGAEIGIGGGLVSEVLAPERTAIALVVDRAHRRVCGSISAASQRAACSPLEWPASAHDVKLSTPIAFFAASAIGCRHPFICLRYGNWLACLNQEMSLLPSRLSSSRTLG
jgi:hypothetical protein